MDETVNGYARLAAAVGSNGTAALNGAGVNDLMGLAMKFLPRMLQNAEERDTLAAEQKEGLAITRKHVLLLRRELRDLIQSHTEVLEELRHMRKLQASVVAHLARVQIMESPGEEEDLGDEDLDELAHAHLPRRGNARRRPREG
jgi:hypothetical protein